MLYIADGTGKFFNDDYAVAMAGSHCARIHVLNKGRAFYHRGPDTFSAIKTTGEIADRIYAQLMQEEFPPAYLAPGQRQSAKSPIFLIGHSRGGAAVVRVAQMLERRKVPVEAMFLFDAVDRTLFLDSVETVPGNVKQCFHAIRNEGAEVVMQHEADTLWKKCMKADGFAELHTQYVHQGSGSYEQFLSVRAAAMAHKWPVLAAAVKAWQLKAQVLQRLKVAMRNSVGLTGTDDGQLKWSIPFGNCAMRFDPKCKGEFESFACSHGAVGGVPWPNLGDEIRKMDEDGAKRAWAWMASRMIQCGIKAPGGI